MSLQYDSGMFLIQQQSLCFSDKKKKGKKRGWRKCKGVCGGGYMTEKGKEKEEGKEVCNTDRAAQILPSLEFGERFVSVCVWVCVCVFL